MVHGLKVALVFFYMPLTTKGKKIKRSMTKTYGKVKGAKVFYASQNKGTIVGTHKTKKK